MELLDEDSSAGTGVDALPAIHPLAKAPKTTRLHQRVFIQADAYPSPGCIENSILAESCHAGSIP